MTHAYTKKWDECVRILRDNVRISQAFDPTTEAPPPCIEFSAIWDTGASNTVVSQRVVKTCGLIPLGKAYAQTAGGNFIQNRYLVRLDLPNRITIPTMWVTEGDLGENLDVLIGMDVIGVGDLAITNSNGKTCLSFQTPSEKCIDFVRDINKQKSISGKSGQKPQNRSRKKSTWKMAKQSRKKNRS